MGYLPTPNIDYDCDCCRMLESMYEDHGDTLALQYGGSQLIHRYVRFIYKLFLNCDIVLNMFDKLEM